MFYPGYYGDNYHVNPHIGRHLIYSADTKYLEVHAHDKTVVNHARGHQGNKNKPLRGREDVLPQTHHIVKSDHTEGIKHNYNNLGGKNTNKRRNGGEKNDSDVSDSPETADQDEEYSESIENGY